MSFLLLPLNLFFLLGLIFHPWQLVIGTSTTINGTVRSHNQLSTWPLKNTNLVLIIKFNTNHEKVHQLRLNISQSSFPLVFNFKNIDEIKTSGYHLLALLIFGYPHLLLWETVFFQQYLEVNQINNINFVVHDVSNVLHCLAEHYPCMATVEKLTYDVSVCCSEYHCIGSGRNQSVCVDKQKEVVIGKPITPTTTRTTSIITTTATTITAIITTTTTTTTTTTAAATPVPSATATPVPSATATPVSSATATPVPSATSTAAALPTATATPVSSATATPVPSATSTAAAAPVPSATATPVPSATATPVPSATSTAAAAVPSATATPVPSATATPVPSATTTTAAAAVPSATATPVPSATATPVPSATSTPVPSATATATPSATATPVPSATPALSATATPVPSVTSTAVPSATAVSSATSTTTSVATTTTEPSPSISLPSSSSATSTTTSVATTTTEPSPSISLPSSSSATISVPETTITTLETFTESSTEMTTDGTQTTSLLPISLDNTTAGYNGLCFNNDTSNMTSVLLITFGSGSSVFSSATPSFFSLSETYVQAFDSSIFVEGWFAFLNKVPTYPTGEWYGGALDHTPGDINGYMFVINALINAHQIFNFTVHNLCIGVHYEFSAYVANIVNLSNVTKPNILFQVRTATVDNSLLTELSSGDIAEYSNMTWLKYGLSFIPSNTSVVLLMISNAQGENSFAIDDIALRVCSTASSGFCFPAPTCYSPSPLTASDIFWSLQGSTANYSIAYLQNSTTDNQSCFVPGIRGESSAILLSADFKQYFTIDYPFDFRNTSLSVSAWIYLNSNQSDMTIFVQCQNGNLSDCIRMYIQNQIIYFSWGPLSLSGNIYSNTILNINRWYHVAFIYNSSSLAQTIYLDGLVDSSITTAGSQSVPPSSITIGRGLDSETTYFDGMIDRFSLINQTMNDTAVLKEASLTAYYSFDNSIGNDSGPNNISASSLNVQLETGKFNQSLSFSQSKSYFQAERCLLLGDSYRSYSFTLWINPSINHTNGSIIHTISDNYWCLPILGFNINGNIVAQSSNGAIQEIIGPQLSINQWVHIAVTYKSNSNLSLYENGLLVGTIDLFSYASSGLPVTVTIGYPVLEIGCRTNSLEPGQFYGKIDDLRIYSRSLSDADIVQIMKKNQ